jgi:hypothetical protein
MHNQRVARDGFGGTWTGAAQGALPIADDGKLVPVPHGRFCALRRG